MGEGGQPTPAPGFVAAAVLFWGVGFGTMLLTLFAYVLIVERWGLIPVRREFGFDMMLYAPMAGLVVALWSAVAAVRTKLPARQAMLAGGLMALLGLVLMLIFVAFGAVY